MTLKKPQILIALALCILVLIVAAFFMYQSKTGTDQVPEVVLPTESALDVTLDFYNAWLAAALSTTTDPVAAGLLDLPILSTEVKEKVFNEMSQQTPESRDPVICQVSAPERVGGKELYVQDTEAQIMILARGLEEKSPFQSIVTLKAVDGKWQISDITCANGEVGPVKDFDFEREGFLLKSVPPPLDPNVWHLVYEENGQKGRTVPLTINESSICVQPGGQETPCDESTFKDATKVFLRADMSETGATVRRLEF